MTHNYAALGLRLAFVFELQGTMDRPAGPDDTRGRAVAKLQCISADNDTEYRAGNEFEGMTCASFTGDRSEGFRWFGTQMDVPSRSISLPESERVHKALRTVDNKLTKYAADGFGEPATFGQYVSRVAKAIGVKEIGFYPPYGRLYWASGYRLQFDGLADGARHIDDLIRQWSESNGQYAPKVAVSA